MKINPLVLEAIKNNKPVVALESTIISHGMPYPENVEFAHEVEKIIRAEGAVPAGGRRPVGRRGRGEARGGARPAEEVRERPEPRRARGRHARPFHLLRVQGPRAHPPGGGRA